MYYNLEFHSGDRGNKKFTLTTRVSTANQMFNIIEMMKVEQETSGPLEYELLEPLNDVLKNYGWNCYVRSEYFHSSTDVIVEIILDCSHYIPYDDEPQVERKDFWSEFVAGSILTDVLKYFKINQDYDIRIQGNQWDVKKIKALHCFTK